MLLLASHNSFKLESFDLLLKNLHRQLVTDSAHQQILVFHMFDEETLMLISLV